MTPVHGLAELEARYGKLLIGPDAQGGNRILQPIGWETKWMVGMHDLPGLGPDSKLYVNRDLVEPLRSALTDAAIQAPEYKIHTIGCWSVRPKGSNRAQLSVHSWGLAVDINQHTNPMRNRIVTDMPVLFVDAFCRAGFTWGGHFPTPDPMHFQLASGY